jgi:glycosyltransferase involved in cell wall biosynthesis
MDNQLVSIIIPTYNRAHILSETLDSIIAQTYKKWECIIVDDGSNDNTESLVNKYVEKDNRFVFLKRLDTRTKGANGCRNYGFEKSKGEFINWFDSDDIMKPNFLNKKLGLFTDGLDAVISYGAYFEDSILEYQISKPLMQSTILDFVKGSFYLSTPGPLWKRAFLENKKLFDEKRQKIQDTEFHFRMLISELKYKFLENDFLFYVRRGEDRTSSKTELTSEKLQDVFNYHYFTFCKSNDIPEDSLEDYIYITSKKTLASFYESIIFQDDISNRIHLYSKNKTKIQNVIKASKHNFISRIKIKFGIYTAIVLRKGYKLLTS